MKCDGSIRCTQNIKLKTQQENLNEKSILQCSLLNMEISIGRRGECYHTNYPIWKKRIGSWIFCFSIYHISYYIKACRLKKIKKCAGQTSKEGIVMGNFHNTLGLAIKLHAKENHAKCFLSVPKVSFNTFYLNVVRSTYETSYVLRFQLVCKGCQEATIRIWISIWGRL